MLDVQSILNDPRYQREAQRRIVEARASSVANMGGTWKEKAVNAAFLSASSEQAKKQYNDLLVGSKKVRQAEALKRAREQYNANLSMRQDRASRNESDSRTGDIVSGAGVLAAGYTANENLKEQKAIANDLRRMSPLYRGGV